MAAYPIDTSPTKASLGQNGINHLRSAQAGLERHRDLMLAAVGAPADYSKLEGATAGFGITANATPGQVGQAVYDAFNGMTTALLAISENFVGPIDQGG